MFICIRTHTHTHSLSLSLSLSHVTIHKHKHTHVCVYGYTHTHTHTHTYIYTHIHTYMYVCIQTHTHTHIHTHTWVCMCVCVYNVRYQVSSGCRTCEDVRYIVRSCRCNTQFCCNKSLRSRTSASNATPSISFFSFFFPIKVLMCVSSCASISCRESKILSTSVYNDLFTVNYKSAYNGTVIFYLTSTSSFVLRASTSSAW